MIKLELSNYSTYLATITGSFLTISFILLNDFYKSRKQDKVFLMAFKDELEYNLKVSETNIELLTKELKHFEKGQISPVPLHNLQNNIGILLSINMPKKLISEEITPLIGVYLFNVGLTNDHIQNRELFKNINRSLVDIKPDLKIRNGILIEYSKRLIGFIKDLDSTGKFN